MKIIHLAFAPSLPVDGQPGRAFYFTSEAVAKKFVESQAALGFPAPLPLAVPLFDSAEDANKHLEDLATQAALAKIPHEDRVRLGLVKPPKSETHKPAAPAADTTTPAPAAPAAAAPSSGRPPAQVVTS